MNWKGSQKHLVTSGSAKGLAWRWAGGVAVEWRGVCSPDAALRERRRLQDRLPPRPITWAHD